MPLKRRWRGVDSREGPPQKKVNAKARRLTIHALEELELEQHEQLPLPIKGEETQGEILEEEEENDTDLHHFAKGGGPDLSSLRGVRPSALFSLLSLIPLPENILPRWLTTKA